MTIISNPVTGPVLGQPLQPNFGVQFSGAPPANTIVAPVPLAANIGGTNKTILEACGLGELPRNSMLATVAGQAVSAGISQSQGDGMSVDEGMSGGNGAEMCLGVAVPPNAQNTNAVTTAGVNNQIFVEGTANSNDALSTGPTFTNTESVVSAPTPGSTTLANITLLAGAYSG